MDCKDLISIVVPFRNVKPYLEDCLKSIQNQTYTNFEAILLDDASDDGSEKIAEDFSKKDNRFVYHKLPKQKSIAVLRNLGVEFAKGKYLAWIDSDDIVSKDFLKVLYLLMVSGNYQMSVCSFVRSKNRNIYLEKYSKHFHKKSYSALDAQKICLSSNKIGGFLPLKLFVTELAKKVKFNDRLRACEDLAYVVEYLDLCSNICRTPKKLYLYFVRRGSISHSNKLKNMLNFVRGLNYLVRYSKDKPYYHQAVCWRAFISTMPITYSAKEMKQSKARRLKVLFAKYFEMAHETIKSHKHEKFGSYTRLLIAFFYCRYKKYLKTSNN